MGRKEFLNAIKSCRRKLNIAQFLKMLMVSLCVGSVIGILFQTVAFLVPFYYANRYSVEAVIIATITAFVGSLIKRKNMKDAALVMDNFGFRERIITAYEHLDEDDKIINMQREDAMRQLKTYGDKIQIRLLPNWKSMVITISLLLVMIVMMLIPAEVKKQATLLHKVEEKAEEKIEEIEEVVEELEELAQKEGLTPEQLEQLQEMIDNMEASMKEYEQATTDKMVSNADEKLEYKYEEMSKQMGDMAQMLESGANLSPETMQAMSDMAQKMQEMSGGQKLTTNQGQQGQNGSGQGNSQQGQSNGNQQNGQQNQGSNSQSGQDGNGQQGQNGDGQQNQNGTGQGQNSTGQGQNGTGQGQNGEGQGQDGSGSGNGQSNSTNGGGRGEGGGSVPHDYVSIPNELIDTGNLTGKPTEQGDSEYFRAQTGMVWEGTHVSHEEVIGSYEQNAYEGISSGKYPSGMESVIKEYFASFNE